MNTQWVLQTTFNGGNLYIKFLEILYCSALVLDCLDCIAASLVTGIMRYYGYAKGQRLRLGSESLTMRFIPLYTKLYIVVRWDSELFANIVFNRSMPILNLASRKSLNLTLFLETLLVWGIQYQYADNSLHLWAPHHCNLPSQKIMAYNVQVYFSLIIR